ncbi:MAG: glycerate kinase [Bacteroidales bacterium]|nr:glycerate kinase [Bacteroidales bacterium]
MKILIACDKMKGTFSSKQLGEMIENAIKKLHPDAETEMIQVSDGGDGFVESLRWRNNFSRWEFLSFNAAKRKIQSKYLYNIYTHTAVLESALTLSINKLAAQEKHILQNSSYGLGFDISRVIEVRHPQKIVVGIGGTSTNDLFLGGASALGFMFLDKEGNEVEPIPQNFLNINNIIPSNKYSGIEFFAAVDVKNPLLGDLGATKVYAAQKGATPQDIDYMEDAFHHIANVIHKDLGVDLTQIDGAGAGGGIGGGMAAFLNAKIISGADFILDNIEIDNKISESDLVITGEGSFDRQSMMGKITGNIINRCQKHNKQTLIISGLYDNTPLPPNCRNIALFDEYPGFKFASEYTGIRINEEIKKIKL